MQRYEELELTVVRFGSEDVIVTSDNDDEGPIIGK